MLVMAPPIEDWVLLHQRAIKKMPPKTRLQTNLSFLLPAQTIIVTIFLHSFKTLERNKFGRRRNKSFLLNVSFFLIPYRAI